MNTILRVLETGLSMYISQEVYRLKTQAVHAVLLAGIPSAGIKVKSRKKFNILLYGQAKIIIMNLIIPK